MTVDTGFTGGKKVLMIYVPIVMFHKTFHIHASLLPQSKTIGNGYHLWI